MRRFPGLLGLGREPSAPAPRPAGPGATDAPATEPSARAPEIDAIRGWAALSVVCFHVFWETFGFAVPWFRNPYTAPLIAGHFDVILFFILSGDALSFPFFHGGGAPYLQRAALKRYARLTVPIAVVTAVTASAVAAGLAPTVAAGDIVGRADWLGSFARFNASGNSAVRFALFFVYAGNYPANYLPFLWTMPIEFAGSLVLVLALFVCPRIRGASGVVAAVALVLLRADFYVGCFLVGMLLGKARAEGLYARLPHLFRRVLAPVGALAALWLVGRRQVTGDQNLFGLASMAAVLLFCLYSCPPAVDWLSRSRTSQFLGRISYLLYLWHYPVLITLTSGAIVLIGGGEHGLSPGAAGGIGAATVAVSVLVSHATLFVEGWSRDANGLLLRILWRGDTPDAVGRRVRAVP